MGNNEEENPVRKSIQDELNTYSSILNKAAKIVEIIPRVEELKEEAEAKLFAVNELPEDVLVELTPHLLVDQNQDYKYVHILNNSLPTIDPIKVSLTSTSGTTSSISVAISEAYPQFQDRPLWATHVIDRFSEIADIKAKRNGLPQAINALAPLLGDEFIKAEESVQQAKAGIIQPHQAASSMRNLIQQVWGEFVNRARLAHGVTFVEKRYELKKASHRAEISHVIAPSSSDLILENRLEMLYGVYQDLSGLSKRTGTPPLKLLHDLRTRWILTLDSLRPFFVKDESETA